MGSGRDRRRAAAADAGEFAVTLAEFEQRVYSVAVASPVCGIPTLRRLTATSISLRVSVTTGGFIDVFYNEQTGATAFALIRQGRRVFGADNPGGWHVHPLADPGQHVPLSSAMSFADFVAEVEQSVAD